MAGHRQSITFTQAQATYLTAEAERLGIKVSELVRRIVDQHREQQSRARRRSKDEREGWDGGDR